MKLTVLSTFFIFLNDLIWIIEPQNILSLKGPVKIIKSKSWSYTKPPTYQTSLEAFSRCFLKSGSSVPWPQPWGTSSSSWPPQRILVKNLFLIPSLYLPCRSFMLFLKFHHWFVFVFLWNNPLGFTADRETHHKSLQILLNIENIFKLKILNVYRRP